jgi:hypothetical protein
MLAMEAVESLDKIIVDLVQVKRTKPSLPMWDMIFSVLYNAKRYAEQENETVTLYQINGNDMLYVPNERKFKISVEGITFNFTLEQLVTAIHEERFLPSK